MQKFGEEELKALKFVSFGTFGATEKHKLFMTTNQTSIMEGQMHTFIKIYFITEFFATPYNIQN